MASNKKATGAMLVCFGEVNLTRLMLRESVMDDVTTIVHAERITRGAYARRADFDSGLVADLFDSADSFKKAEDKAWSEHFASVKRAAEDAAELSLMKWQRNVLVPAMRAGQTLIVAHDADYFEHDPATGTYCNLPARAMWENIVECADVVLH
jgi:hypothetical protein